MLALLQEQRVGNDGADRCKRQCGGHCVFRTMKQNAHHKTAFGLRFDCNRTRAATATRHVVIPSEFLRHFSSPDGLGLGLRIAAPVSTSQYCLIAWTPKACAPAACTSSAMPLPPRVLRRSCSVH